MRACPKPPLSWRNSASAMTGARPGCKTWGLDRQLRRRFHPASLSLSSALRGRRQRTRLYRGNYALIQALYALRDNDQAEFEDGIADYR